MPNPRTSNRTIDRATLAAVLLLAALLFSTPLRPHAGDLLSYAQDDLYYYLVAARNLAAGHGSTFDGTTLTNGYHPLYFVLLWAASLATHTLRGLFTILFALDLAATATTFLAARAFFRRALPDAWLPNALALLVTGLCCLTFTQQMEVTLALPLAFLFLTLLARPPQTLAAYILLGVTAGLLILARLDTALLILLTLTAAILEPTYRRTLSSTKILSFAAASVPWLVAYLAINLHVFHRLLPISGQAKDLKQTHGLSFAILRASLSPGAALLFLLCFLALCALPLFWSRLSPGQRVVALAAPAFPFLHWGTLLSLSDWRLWGWYGYSLRIGMLAVLLLFGLALQALPAKLNKPIAITLFTAAMLLFATQRYRRDPEMIDIAQTARQLQRFAQTHPGGYAMGDRAGMVGYVLPAPLIQTEGLMMDAPFLDRIRSRQPLRQALADLNIDFYVAFTRQPLTACFQAREPANAGPASPTMQATFCTPPAAIIPAPSGQTLIYSLK